MLIRRTPANVDRFFNEWNRALNNSNSNITLDVHENEDEYTVIADVPGISSESLDIRLHENVLIISAENTIENTEERGKAILQERHSGKVSRSLRFPVNLNADNVVADYNDGVLIVTVPKAEEVKPRRIEIKRA